MINAARTASGRSLNNGVSATTVIRLRRAATMGGDLRAGPGAVVHGGLREASPAGQPPNTPEPMLASPSAIISWLDSSR